MHSQLLSAGQFHLGLHLGVVHQREFTEIHATGVRLMRFGGRRAFGKNFQQGHGISLDQRGLVLVQQAQRIAGQIAPRNVAQL